MNTWNPLRSVRRVLVSIIGLCLVASPSAFAAAFGTSPDSGNIFFSISPANFTIN